MKNAKPIFNLAPLTEWPSTILSPNRPADALILAMAVAFNDLKDIEWLFDNLSSHRSAVSAGTNPQRGQLSGMIFFCERKRIAVFYEFLTLLRKSGKAIKSAPFQDFLLKQSTKTKSRWELFYLMANKPESVMDQGAKNIAQLALRVRNNVSNHYYGKDIPQGYASFLKSAHGATIYASLGTCLDESRFYFADAACEGYQKEIYQECGTTIKEVREQLMRMNEFLRKFIEAYLRYREKVEEKGARKFKAKT